MADKKDKEIEEQISTPNYIIGTDFKSIQNVDP